jgi:chemotaxis protein histidine kinase CheA
MSSQPLEPGSADVDLSVYHDLYLRETGAFLTSLRQNLARLDADLEDAAAYQEAHRAAHTLKGMSATMRYATLADLAENLEKLLLTGFPLNAEKLQALRAGCDAFEAGLQRLERQATAGEQ